MGKKGKARKPAAGLAALGVLPPLKKPTSAIGKTLHIPGSWWHGEDPKKMCEATVTEFDAVHRFSGSVSSAMELTVDGDISTYWMKYPMPFLEHWYKSHPQTNEAAVAKDIIELGDSDESLDDWVSDDEGGGAVAKEKATVYEFLSDPIRVEKVPGKCRGEVVTKLRSVHRCKVQVADGVMCNEEVPVLGGVTSNAISHMRLRGHTCVHHKVALEKIESKSGRRVAQPDGTNVPVHTFKEMFPHHCRFIKLISDGLPQTIARKPSFTGYVHGFDARATMPHHVTIHRIAAVKLMKVHAKMRKTFSCQRKQWKGRRWYGLQLDLWVDEATGVCFAAVSITYTEPTAKQLDLVKTPLEFERFPYTRHTAENIKNWLLATLNRWDLPACECAGITPDGEKAGVSALWHIEDLRAYVDVCLLHQLQRATLFCVGKAGTTCENKPARALLRKHERVVKLSHQSGPVEDGIEEQQLQGDVPPHKTLLTVRTNTTRWCNIYNQLKVDITLQPCIDPVLANHRAKNKGKAVIDEPVDDFAAELKTKGDEIEHQARVCGRVKSREVMADDIGLTMADWEESTHLAAFLQAPADAKELIEKNNLLTGAQGMQLMKGLENGCDDDLAVKQLPTNVTYRARKKRKLRQVHWADLCDAVQRASVVMKDELTERFFGSDEHEKPSVLRLVQLYMSKQMPIQSVLKAELVAEAKSAYLRHLRSAAELLGKTSKAATPPVKKAKLSKKQLFSPPPSANIFGSPPADASQDDDAVLREVEEWAALPATIISKHTNRVTNMINEFTLMHELKDSFPLHYTVFRQTAVHISHEADVESLFSLAKGLTHWNMKPAFLRVLTLLKSCIVYEPTIEEMWEEYKSKYGVHDGVSLEVDSESEEEMIESE